MTEQLKQKIEALKELEQAATPGPWTFAEADGWCDSVDSGKWPCCKGHNDLSELGGWCDTCEFWEWGAPGAIIPEAFAISVGEYDAMSNENAKLIAEARNMLPELIELAESADVWKQWYQKADAERSVCKKERDQLMKQSEDRGTIFLLYSCNESKEYSSMSLVVATTDRCALEKVIRYEILDKSMEYNGLSGVDGVAEFDRQNDQSWEGDYSNLNYGFVSAVKNGEVQ